MSEDGNVTQEQLQEAMDRYPGLPMPLAVVKYMMDQAQEGEGMPPLAKGCAWGGVHLERAGVLLQQLVDAMYHQNKKSITVRIEATDFPETYDHLWVEVTDVEGGTQDDLDRMLLAGWPCCACDDVIAGGDFGASVMMLNKRAQWEHPTWGNVLDGTGGRAVAALCGACLQGEKPPRYAIKNEGDQHIRVPLDGLEDIEQGGPDECGRHDPVAEE